MGTKRGVPVVRVCEQCTREFSRTARQVSKGRARRFCSYACHNLFQTGKPKPGFVTPDSDKAQRIRAQGIVNMRLRRGWFVKPTDCAKCGATVPLEGHHPNYCKPAEVFWLCQSCHVTAHHHPESLAGMAPFLCERTTLPTPTLPTGRIETLTPNAPATTGEERGES